MFTAVVNIAKSRICRHHNVGPNERGDKLSRFPVVLASLILLTSAAGGFAQDNCVPADSCRLSSVGLSEAEIAAYSGPSIEPLRPDNDILFDRAYQRVVGVVEIYDAPNGIRINTLGEGFNFVTTLGSQDGWTEINPGQWVRSEHLAGPPAISRFAGVLLPEQPLTYPVAWTLINLYPSRSPGGRPSMSNPLLYRYTRVNLYAAVEVAGWLWYQVGPDQWVHQTHVAKYSPIERPADVDTDYWLGVDLYEQTVVAYEGDTPVFTSLIAAGLAQWPTREGVYHIYFRRPRHTMNGGRAGYDFYYIEEVPWTMFFDEGRALHGAYWHDEFGYRHSHGCINLSLNDAYWLYHWVAEHMGSWASADIEDGPAVFIYSSGEYR